MNIEPLVGQRSTAIADDPLVSVAEQPDPQALFPEPEPPAPGDALPVVVVDYEQLFPKPWSQHKTAIIEVALPALLQVMLCAEHAALTPRQKVEKAFAEISKQRNEFWGAYGVFTRRRSAIDSVLSGFYDTLWDHVAARSCGNRSSSSRASQAVARRSS